MKCWEVALLSRWKWKWLLVGGSHKNASGFGYHLNCDFSKWLGELMSVTLLLNHLYTDYLDGWPSGKTTIIVLQVEDKNTNIGSKCPQQSHYDRITAQVRVLNLAITFLPMQVKFLLACNTGQLGMGSIIATLVAI